MTNLDEVVPGLSSDDIKIITEQVYNRTDGNHPHYPHEENNGFLDIFENAEPSISASPIFIKKVSL